MSKIHLVRHGQAAAGFGTHKDPGLNELGLEQARAVAAALAPLGPLAIYSSPLARAMETAQPLADLWNQNRNQQIEVEPRMAEIPSPTDDLSQRAQWLSQAMQGGWREQSKSLQAWRAAIADCLRQIEHDCVVFSHYVAINAAVGIALDDDRMAIFAPDNCSVTTLENREGELSVVALGQTAQTKIN